MSASQLAAVVLLLEVTAAAAVIAVLLVLYRRLQHALALVGEEREAREASARHTRETVQALRATTDREAVVLDNIDELVFRLRQDGGTWIPDFVSRRVTALLGYSPDEMIAMGAGPVHPDDLPLVVAETEAALQAPTTRTFQYRIRHLNGDYRWFENRIRAANAPGPAGAVIYGVARDVTERLAAEDALRRSGETLQQAQRMEALGRLAGGIAHDFNNLLTAMIGNAGYLLEVSAADDPRRAALEEIIDAGDRGQRFTRQLLAFSRNQVLQTEPIDLADVVTGMQSMLARLIGPEYRLETALAAGLPRVEADRGQIEQMVLNLVVNARDAMPAGGAIAVRTRAEDRGGRPGVLLEVEDEGSGIPPEVRARIFEPFFTTKGEGGGTGLGLSMIYGFVTQSGGEIDVLSQPGRGTSFRIFLPAPGAGPEARRPHSPALLPAAADEPPTVLVVDDEPSVRTLAAAMLRRAGYAVVEAADGAEAERLAAGHVGRIDVLLTDIVMPGTRGPELADRLRAVRPELRVVYMSGFRDTAMLADVERGEAVFLGKPFVGSALLAAIRRTAAAGTV